VLAKVHDQQTRRKKSLKENSLKKQLGESLILRFIAKRRKDTLRTEAIFNDRPSNSGTTTRNYSNSRKNKRFTY
jgi:hypothetical protein